MSLLKGMRSTLKAKKFKQVTCKMSVIFLVSIDRATQLTNEKLQSFREEKRITVVFIKIDMFPTLRVSPIPSRPIPSHPVPSRPVPFLSSPLSDPSARHVEEAGHQVALLVGRGK